jgi:hypothetical protein
VVGYLHVSRRRWGRLGAVMTAAMLAGSALTACGGSSAGSTVRHALTVRRELGAFAACLRQGGVEVPASHLSGSGPVFSIDGLDTRSARFKEAWADCRAHVDVSTAVHIPGRDGALPGDREQAGGGAGER